MLEVTPNAVPLSCRSIMWCKEIPIKTLCFVWRAAMGRIPSKVAIQNRGVPVSVKNCSSCGSDYEDADHILVACPFAMQVWRWIWSWCGLQSQNFQSINDLLISLGATGGCTRRRLMLHAIFYGTLWCLWKARNDRTFTNKSSSASRVTDEILSLTFSWFKYRGNLGNCFWPLWCISPFGCM